VDVAKRAFNAERVAVELSAAFRPDEKRDVHAGFRPPATEIATDRARAEYE